MPIYEYACTACDHRLDILLGINDPGPQFCPSCGKQGTMRKLFAPPTIHYKGSGWAKKDRGSSPGTRASATARSDASGDGSKDASKEGSKESPKESATDGSSSTSTPSDASSSSSSSSSTAGPRGD